MKSVRRHGTSPSLLSLLNPFRIIIDCWRSLDLILQLSAAEVMNRYRGSFLGILWSLVVPLVMITAYTFVFSGIFKAKWGGSSDETPVEFGIALFCGLMFFSIFSEVVSQCPTLIRMNSSYVKRVSFPLEILPIVVLNATLTHALLSLGVLLSVIYAVNGSIALSALLLPLIFAPLLMCTLGIAWFVSSTSVFIRDVTQFTQICLQLLFFMTPIFYPLSAVPEPARVILQYNPLAVIIEAARDILLWAVEPNWQQIGFTYLGSFLLMCAGYAWFMKTKRGFADVI